MRDLAFMMPDGTSATLRLGAQDWRRIAHDAPPPHRRSSKATKRHAGLHREMIAWSRALRIAKAEWSAAVSCAIDADSAERARLTMLARRADAVAAVFERAEAAYHRSAEEAAAEAWPRR